MIPPLNIHSFSGAIYCYNYYYFIVTDQSVSQRIMVLPGMTWTERAAVPNSPVVVSTALSCIQEKTKHLQLKKLQEESLKCKQRYFIVSDLKKFQSPEARRTPSSQLSSGSQNHPRSRWRSCCTELHTSHLDSHPVTHKCTKEKEYEDFRFYHMPFKALFSYFWPLGGRQIPKQTRRNKALMCHRLVMANRLANHNTNSHWKTRRNMIFHLESWLCQPNEFKSF